MKKQNNGVSGSTMAAAAAGAAALGGAAYYFLGPKGSQHQKSAKKWALDAKKKVAAKVKKAQNLSEPIYRGIIDDVVTPYIAKGATSKEAAAFASALKSDWKHIAALAKKKVTGMRGMAKVKSAAKTAAKKVVAKAKAKIKTK